MASELQAGKYLADGHSASAPSYSFSHTTATGMYSPGANQIRFSTASTDRLTISSTGQALFSGSKVTVNTDGTVDWGNAADAGRLTWDTNDAKVRGVAGKNLKLGANNTDYVTIDTTGLATFSAGITVSGGFTNIGSSFTEVTIASGAITVTKSVHLVDTEGDAATDDLDTINGGTTGAILVLRNYDNARDVTVKDATGNIYLAGDFALNNGQRKLTLMKYGGGWYELSRSANA